ncbi:TauD/TfdA family dioxygenase [Amycolatopsis vastitatis]|uniref:TauD/TfdA-like domain-containing protein n=1 Tax=Amycolatopsis vastitatis TaxID=1905142 RepID=A0A229SL45_9PSEU|nr:TauD/TfdA family dioxygenase [Amycolatopsis vastitatis]OXM59361.1 hypothetical protein CF165_48180 [Amycolatopsis vastitatis]
MTSVSSVSEGSLPKITELQLTGNESEEAHRLTLACARRHPETDTSDFLRFARTLACRLPMRILSFLEEFRQAEDLHAAVIHGHHIATETLEPTPSTWQNGRTPGSRPYSWLLTLLASWLGDVIGWQSQQSGRLVTDVVPSPGMEQSLVSSCSDRELSWHTEDAWSESRADYVGLFCLRNPSHVGTTLSFLDTRDLPPKILTVLQEARFVFARDESHTDEEPPGETRRSPNVPVLTGNPRCPQLRADRDFMAERPGDAVARNALRMLITQLDSNLTDIALAPGDLLFVNNRIAVHGRRPFTPRYDGADRWLKRVNIVRDLWRTQVDSTEENNRILV